MCSIKSTGMHFLISILFTSLLFILTSDPPWRCCPRILCWNVRIASITWAPSEGSSCEIANTCYSVYLWQIRTSQKDMRCLWCHSITKLPLGFSMLHLPNDPKVLALIIIPHISEHSSVFIKLPSNGCNILSLPISEECMLLPLSQKTSITMVTSHAEQHLLQGGAPQEAAVEEPDRQGMVKTPTWSCVCSHVGVLCLALPPGHCATQLVLHF